jgi:outer membrane protein assembly factor BamA
VRAVVLVSVVVILAAVGTLQLVPSGSGIPSGPRAPSEASGSDTGRTSSASTPGGLPGSPAVQEVRSISLVGNRVPQSQLRELLETRAGDPLDAARLARDRETMERALADLGYLAARVEPASVVLDAAGAAYVTYEIDQGKLFQLRTIEVTGAGKDAAVVTLVAGDEARRDRIEQARVALADALARHSKAATVELSVHTDLAAAAVDVTLTTRVPEKPAKPKKAAKPANK